MPMVSNAARNRVKCISFKLSRVRFASEPDMSSRELVVTGSWMEEVNRICLWQYDCGDLIDSGRLKVHSEAEYDLSAGVLGDSADDPRLVDSLLHSGWVQDLKVHPLSRRIYSASSDGSLQIFSADTSDSVRLRRITDPDWVPFSQTGIPANLPISLASLTVSSDGDQVYFADDLGRLAVANVARIPSATKTCSDDQQDEGFEKTRTPVDRSALVETGADVASVNALERVDNSCLVSANQLGQLKVWDLRCGLQKPQQRLLRPGETQPLYCLGPHPGQPHLLAVGGVTGSIGSAAYIWDLRAEQYPLSEIACDGQSVWELGFHRRHPRHLYLATETAGLLRISSSRDDNDSWTGFKGSRRKLIVSDAILPGATRVRNVISFDLSNSKLVCAHSDSTLQTVPCDDVFAY